MELRFRADYSITFRLFNEGLAYRFSTSINEELNIERENLEINLMTNDSARFQSSESFNSSYETPYEFNSIGGIESG